MIILVISGVLGIRAINLAIHGSRSEGSPEGAVLGVTDTPTSKQLFDDYTVKKGQTVFSIAQEHHLDWTALATLNNLKAPFALQPGQILKIPRQ
jgi:LysM repeat protein